MARKSKASFKMKGHTLPGINQKSETVNIKDGRSPSSAFQQIETPVKSPLEQKLSENPRGHVAPPGEGDHWRGYKKGDGHTNLGVIRPNEEEWYEDNPRMSPTADEQDIFSGKDIEATRDQYDNIGVDEPKTYSTINKWGNRISMQNDMSGNHANDQAYINYAKRLERERDMEDTKSATPMKSPLEQRTAHKPKNVVTPAEKKEYDKEVGDYVRSSAIVNSKKGKKLEKRRLAKEARAAKGPKKGINIDFRKTKSNKKGTGGKIGIRLIPKITRKGRGINFN